MAVLEEYIARPYARILTPDRETGTYTAEVLEFPGCFGQGDTPDEAIRDLEASMEAWIEATLAAGGAVPEPLETRNFSGHISLRLPKSYHQQIALLAEVDGVSINQWIVNAIAERTGMTKAIDLARSG